MAGTNCRSTCSELGIIIQLSEQCRFSLELAQHYAPNYADQVSLTSISDNCAERGRYGCQKENKFLPWDINLHQNNFRCVRLCFTFAFKLLSQAICHHNIALTRMFFVLKKTRTVCQNKLRIWIDKTLPGSLKISLTVEAYKPSNILIV